MFKIYALKNNCNTKVYIGQTMLEIKNRWHSGSGYKDCILIERAIEKYGKENFYYDIILECTEDYEANYWEEYYIEVYGARNPNIGYNLSVGGAGGFTGRKHTNETKQKISLAKTGNCKINDGSFQAGSVPWHAGRTGVYSEETLEAMSNARKGKPPVNKGMPRSFETKQKISKSLMGNKPTEENLQKRSASMKEYWAKKKLNILEVK